MIDGCSLELRVAISLTVLFAATSHKLYDSSVIITLKVLVYITFRDLYCTIVKHNTTITNFLEGTETPLPQTPFHWMQIALSLGLKKSCRRLRNYRYLLSLIT